MTSNGCVRKRIYSLTLWFDRLHWVWLILAAPLLLFPNPTRTLALWVVPGLGLLRWFLIRRPSSLACRSQSSQPLGPLSVTPLNSSILLLSIMVLVSTWATYDIAFSLPKISGMVLGLGAFFAVVREGRSAKGWWLSLAFFLAIGVGIAGLGLLGTHWVISKFEFINPITGHFPGLIFGLQGAESGFHPNEVAGALLWVLPVLFSLSVYITLSKMSLRAPEGGVAISTNVSQRLLRRSERRRRAAKKLKTCYCEPCTERSEVASEAISHLVRMRLRQPSGLRNDPPKDQRWYVMGLRLLLWFTTLLVAAVFMLTQSRGGYIGLAVTGLAMLMMALSPRRRWLFLGGLLAAGLILGVVLARGENQMMIRTWLSGSDIISGSALSLNTLEGRLEIWSRAIYGIQDFSFTGMGMNTFREVVHVLYPFFLITPGVDIGHAHNEFLQAALDLGIPGLIAFLALYIGAFWMLGDIWKNVRCATGDGRPLSFASPALMRTIVLGLGGGLAAHLLYGLIDAVALGAKPGVLFWMLLGLIAGLYAQVHSANPPAELTTKPVEG